MTGYEIQENLQEKSQDELQEKMFDAIEALFDDLDGENPFGDLLELGWVALPRGSDDSQQTNFRGGLEAVSQRRLAAMTGGGSAGGVGDGLPLSLDSEAVPLWMESGQLERASETVQSMTATGKNRGVESVSTVGGRRESLVEQIDRQARNTATAQGMIQSGGGALRQAVVVGGSRVEAASQSALSIDRAMERDARRYDGGFTLG